MLAPAQRLPIHAARRAGWISSRLLSSDAKVGGAFDRVRFIGLDSAGLDLDNALRAVRTLQPRQLMLETCSQRMSFAEKRQAAEAASAKAAEGSSTGATASSSSGEGGADAAGSPLTHADAISLIHGGLRGSYLVELSQVASDMDAQVYYVDRPYQETQNRMARCLFFRPKELVEFLRLSTESLTGQTDGGQAAVLERRCPNAYAVLVKEREQHMATEIARRCVPGVDVVVCCAPERIAGLQALLEAPKGTSSSRHSAQTSSRAWPLLLVLVYLLLPGYGAILLLWKGSRLLADFLSNRLWNAQPPPTQQQLEIESRIGSCADAKG